MLETHGQMLVSLLVLCDFAYGCVRKGRSHSLKAGGSLKKLSQKLWGSSAPAGHVPRPSQVCGYKCKDKWFLFGAAGCASIHLVRDSSSQDAEIGGAHTQYIGGGCSCFPHLNVAELQNCRLSLRSSLGQRSLHPVLSLLANSSLQVWKENSRMSAVCSGTSLARAPPWPSNRSRSNFQL